jgi:hypothetical protein
MCPSPPNQECQFHWTMLGTADIAGPDADPGPA